MFLSLTSIIGKTKDDVVKSLTNYAKSVGGGVEKENLSTNDENCCVIVESNGNTTILNPFDYLEWDRSAEFISKDLNAPVFSFHIHDGDLWMYILFVNGVSVDQFNPIPNYWEDISEEEIQSWEGNATTVASYVKSVKRTDIEKYLVRWDLETEETKKAYPDDEFMQEDWQLLDFMKKLGLPYPIENDGRPKGDTFKFWTKEFPLKVKVAKAASTITTSSVSAPKKPWWKFW